jgi:ProP effector
MTQQATQQQRSFRPKGGNPMANTGPKPTKKQIQESFKPQGSTATRKKNRSQRRLVEELFPQLFVNGYPLPMKSGIKDDMLAQIVRRGLDISEERLQAALRACCASLVYKTRLFTFRFRRDLNGQAVETISKEDRAHAWQGLTEYRKQHKLPAIRPSWFLGVRKKGPNKGRSKPLRGMTTQKNQKVIIPPKSR